MLTIWIERLWFGQEADLRWPGQVARGRAWVGALVVLALFVGRLFLPFYPGASDSRLVYEGIVWALQNHHNWGKQALVGALDYPPLPGVALLFLSPLDTLRHATGWHLPAAATVLVAAAQVWTLVLVVRAVRALIPLRGATVLGVLLFLVLCFSPPVAYADRPTAFYLLVADPFWVCLVPMAGVFLHLVRWEQGDALYDLTMAALYAGLLVFCGLTGIIFAVSALFLMAAHGSQADRPRPSGWLVFMPFVYAGLLHLLFNALIMGDALFAWRHVAAHFAWPAAWEALVTNARLVPLLVVVLLFGVSLLWRRLPLHLRLGWHCMLAAAACHALQQAGGLFLGGAWLFTGFALLPILLFFVNLPRCRNWRLALPLIPLSLAFIPVALMLRLDSLRGEDFTVARPGREELTDYVDHYWKDSRILVYGLRLAVLYAWTAADADQDRQRFVARLDFNENVLREDIEKEQLHLLLPPDDGVYYPRRDRMFDRLRHHPVPGWLLLEEVWPGGWELWRCVRLPPVGLPPPAVAELPAAAAPPTGPAPGSARPAASGP